MDEFFTIINELRDVRVSENEKKFLLKILINHRQRNQLNIKYRNIHKLKSLFYNKRKKDQYDTSPLEAENLIQQKLIFKLNKSQLDSADLVRSKLRSDNEEFKITDNGLIHIFKNNYIYPPSLLLMYENSALLQKILFEFFLHNTIKSSTAKFFSIITGYLADISNYLLIFSKSVNTSITENQKHELEQSLNIFSLELAFRIAVLFNESYLIPPEVNLKNEKAILILHEVETKMKKSLSKDNRFQRLLHKAYVDFNSGYGDITKTDIR